MDPILRRQALRIASKVTLTFSMIACGASVGTEDAEDYSEGTSEDAIKRGKKADAGNDCGKDAALVDGATVKDSGSADAKSAKCKPVVSEDLFGEDNSAAAKEGRACCRAQLTTEIAKGRGVADTEDNFACCSAVSSTFWGGVDADTDPALAEKIQQENMALYNGCCDTYGWGAPMLNPDGGPSKRIVACTPWGPPVPPSMKGARKRFRKNTRKNVVSQLEMNGVA